MPSTRQTKLMTSCTMPCRHGTAGVKRNTKNWKKTVLVFIPASLRHRATWACLSPTSGKRPRTGPLRMLPLPLRLRAEALRLHSRPGDLSRPGAASKAAWPRRSLKPEARDRWELSRRRHAPSTPQRDARAQWMRPSPDSS
eukprot:scaffold79850_cov37-Prasinocladus_malaysianus.AAC.2